MKNNTKLAIQWIVGIIFIMAGCGAIGSGTIIAGILLILGGALLLPFIIKLIEKQIAKPLNGFLKYGVAVILIVIGAILGSQQQKSIDAENLAKLPKRVQDSIINAKNQKDSLEVNINFEQIGYYIKKLPNSSYERVYSYYVSGFQDKPENWQKIEDFAKTQMYNDNGSTTVLFFNDKNGTPDVTLVGLEFDDKYNQYCVAGYWKEVTGYEKFTKYPLKQ